MSVIKIIRRIVTMQFFAAPWLNGFQTLLGAFHALTWVVAMVVTQRLFDTISQAADGNAAFGQVLAPLAWMAVVIVIQQIANGLFGFMIDLIRIKTSGRIKILFFQKLQAIEPASFEDTNFLDDLNKANEAIGSIPHFSMAFTSLAAFYVVYFVFAGAYLFWLSPVLVLTLAISFVPALFSQLAQVKIFTRLEEENAPLRREYNYYKQTMCDREYFKETRILGAYRFFNKLFYETMLLLVQKEWRAESKAATVQLLLNLTSFGGMAASTIILFNVTMAGSITVGAFAAVFGALNIMFDTMDEVVNQQIVYRSRDIGKLANFIRLMDMPERGEAKLNDLSQGVQGEDLWFTYPGREEAAIQGVSLSIAKGETIAIVGENGAGKSTLVRLLTGIYLPDKGTASVNGTAYTGISGVFQKYQRYKMTLQENVTISERSMEADPQKIHQVLREAEADWELDQGLNTMLSPEFDGIDLSGGQWQRIAIARGLYRNSQFIILDEPTAAIDPIEETRLYQQFQRLAKGKCAIVVTHRLGSAKLADKIVVMDGGQIVDTGCHDELLMRPGKYTDMWKAQAQWYER